MNNRYLASLAALACMVSLAHVTLAGYAGSCQTHQNSVDCRPDNTITHPDAAECYSFNPYCRHCPYADNVLARCQSDFRDCLVNGAMELPGDLGPDDCDAMQGKYCAAYDHSSYAKCIMEEPTRKQCWRKRGLNPCDSDEEITSEFMCNMRGCLWCDEYSWFQNKNYCFALPGTSCDDTPHSCCKSRVCIPGNVDPTVCMEKGCKICINPESDEKICVYGTVPATKQSECPSYEEKKGRNFEDCWERESLDVDPSEKHCLDMHCDWCPRKDYCFYCVRTYPPTCNNNPQYLCKKSGLNSYKECKLWGCEWCGPYAAETECHESTKCTTCECPDPVSCWAKSKLACERKKCKWCPYAHHDDYKCININSEGMSHKDVWTKCSKDCGCGTQWKYEDCDDSNALNCPRVYRSCNTHDCPMTICPEGELKRYNDTRSCCCNNTKACGINSLNVKDFHHHLGHDLDGSRKKRVVDGDEVEDKYKWPWVAVIYWGDQKCGAVLVSHEFVITAACCVSGASASDIIVNFDVIDRSLNPGIEVGVSHIYPVEDIALLQLAVPFDSFGPSVSPICMPNGEMVMEDMKCVVAGWGYDGGPKDPDKGYKTCANGWDCCQYDEKCCGKNDGRFGCCSYENGNCCHDAEGPSCCPYGYYCCPGTGYCCESVDQCSKGGCTIGVTEYKDDLNDATYPTEEVCVTQLHDATVKVAPWGMCEQGWGKYVYDLDMDKHFCAGYAEGGRDACIGDKGGPLMCQRCANCGWYLAGIVTEHFGCGHPGNPTVYARMSYYEEWLDDHFDRLDPYNHTCPGATD